VGFEDGLIKIFKRKIVSSTSKKYKNKDLRRSSSVGSIPGYQEDSKDKIENLIGHKGSVFCLSISDDEKLLISGSFDSNIRLWSISTGNCIYCYKAHQGPVWDLKFFTYSNFFVSASADSLAKMWTISKFEPVRIFAYHEVDVIKVEFVSKYKSLVTASIDFTMVIWNIIKGEKMIIIDGINAPIRSLFVTKS